uniref:Uncharacterized protein n=1 Tax=Daphnia galeata TaxID=27404 RepID=A0A8J2WKS3_9CRUS|nr:unnamed protein product [Daphnia galeata]
MKTVLHFKGSEYDFVEDLAFQSKDGARVVEANEEWSPGQNIYLIIVLGFKNSQLAGVDWFPQPRRLEITFCSNRPSQIFKVDISSGKYGNRCLRKNFTSLPTQPRYHSGSDTIIYLSSLAYGPHHKEQKISTITSDETVGQISSLVQHRAKVAYTNLRVKSGLDLMFWILVCGVSLTRPDQLFIGRLSLRAPSNSNQASLIFPKNPSKKNPLGSSRIVRHGGPNTAVSTDQFKLRRVAGQLPCIDWIRIDVQEVLNATVKMIKKYFEFLDKELGLVPRFLSGRLNSQSCDWASMFPITDIADWTIAESNLGNGSELEKLVEPKTFSKMWELSLHQICQAGESCYFAACGENLPLRASSSVDRILSSLATSME